MTLPAFDAALWSSDERRRAYIEAGVAWMERALAMGEAECRAAYEALGPLIEQRAAGKMTMLAASPKTMKRWDELLPRLHEAYYGVAPGRCDAPTLARIFPEIDVATRAALADLVTEIGDVQDGATTRQLLKPVAAAAKTRRWKLSRTLLQRFVCAIEGDVIPPP